MPELRLRQRLAAQQQRQQPRVRPPAGRTAGGGSGLRSRACVRVTLSHAPSSYTRLKNSSRSWKMLSVSAMCAINRIRYSVAYQSLATRFPGGTRWHSIFFNGGGVSAWLFLHAPRAVGDALQQLPGGAAQRLAGRVQQQLQHHRLSPCTALERALVSHTAAMQKPADTRPRVPDEQHRTACMCSLTGRASTAAAQHSTSSRGRRACP